MLVAARTHDYGKQPVDHLAKLLKSEGIEAAQLVLPKAFSEINSYEEVTPQLVEQIRKNFEEENINTLTMDGELLLVILSSVAQQEVENISANVKKGLKMKMQRGELVGFQGCLGYDYNPEDKTLTVNEEEAAVVRYIFQR